ncbi:retinitis pigmentosa 1-like 1 protein [Polyodon spathula]|uniref:retinitis pigmentosa 1-like 1 protein n=1 Tax=Polyodon spathula TaxID=7913 RepID=UPI001B7EAE12|nr:retinitis pigmentosa 1-like 1 protein [Polyodon spathula]
MQSVSLGYPALTIPFNNDQPLPPVSRTAIKVTESTPAKKITFFKSGDPQFSGVRMAIHKRSFKCFDALLDDLSHKVSLPFGVRTITTPRGTHCINRLEQLEDGGCYLCSDRWQVKPISVEAFERKQAPWQSSHPASSRRHLSRLKELPGKQAAHRHPKRITLVKNSDPAVRRTIILNKITARNLKVFLEEISQLLQCTIRRLYTLDGRKIDCIQALMQCPSVVVCVGREPFKPFLAESLRQNSEEKLPGLDARSWTSICSEFHESKKNVNFGLETKKSIIHPRSDSSNRSMRFSLPSEKSLPNMSPRNSGYTSYEDTFPHSKESMMDEDIEKRVLVNKDGSLSVEMKVRFRLLNDETLQWSTLIKKSSFTNKDSCLEKEDEMSPVKETNSEACSGVQAFCHCDTESYCQNCCSHCHYDIWKNPMHAAHSRQEGIGALRHITSSSSSASSHGRIIHKKSSMDSFHTTSSEEYTEHVVEQAMCYAETVEEKDTRVEYCSHGESCSTSSHKAARPEGRTTSVNSQCIPCPSPVENCETTAVTLISDNEEKRPSSISSTSSKGSGNETISVQITEVTEEVEWPNSTSSTSSNVLEALKEEKDDNGDDRPPSSISRDSSQSKNCKKVKNESNDEARSRSVASSCSTISCEKSPFPMHHLSPRPISKASSSSTCSNRSRNKKLCVDHSDDDRCLSIVSSLPNCSTKEPTEEVEHQSAGSSFSTSSKRSKPNKSSKVFLSESDKVTTPGSSVSEIPAGQDTAQAEDENDERPISNMSVSTKASGKSKKSNKFLCSGSERATTPASSSSEVPAGQETVQEAKDASSGRRVSNISVSTRTSGKSKKSNKFLCSGSERATTPGSSASEVPAGQGMPQEAEDASSERPVSNMSVSTKASEKYQKSNKLLCSGSERATTPGSSVSVGAACEEIGSNGRPMSGMSVSTKASGKSKACKICQEDCSEKVPSAISSSSKGSTHMKKGTSSHVSSYLQVKCNGIKSTNPKSDDEGANSVMSRSTRYSNKGSKKHMEEKDPSRISASLSVSSQSLHSPCPPKGKPSKKNVRQKILPGFSKESVTTESISAAELLRENSGNSRPTTESVSEKLKCSRNSKGCKNKKSNILRKNKEEDSEQILDAKELVPSALPNATSTEVVHEWLRKIPADTSIYELGDNFLEECEEPVTKQHQGQISTEPTLATSAAKELIPEEEEPKKELEKLEVKNTQDEENVDVAQCAEDQATANESLSSTVPTFPNKEALPNSWQTSVHVMKVLLNPSQGTKLDRCNSLPEVSATYGRKLNNSAKELLDCFVNLQLSEEPVHSKAKASSARYKELMNILQSLWFGDTSEDGQQKKLEKTFKDHQSTEDEFNLRSSSGVDVSSGSAGSGKSSITGGVEVIQSERKFEMNVEGSVTPTRHDSLHGMLEENKMNEDDQHSGHSTPRSKLNERWAAAFSNSATPDIASRVQWSHESEGIGSEEDKEQKHISEEDTKSSETAEITKEEKEEPNKNVDESRSVTAPQETETRIQEEDTNISEKVAILPKGNSSDPDPVWVLNLLKKLEKQFMTHYMNAVSDFKVKWNLDSSEQLDIMINDLKEEVCMRIQTTIDRELKKIQGRAGRMPHPPPNTIIRESTARTEQMRLRWKVMNRRSVKGSIERSDKNYTFSGIEFSEQHSEDEYCPCDSCMKKKMIDRPAQPVVSTSVYIRKEYDLRQILCMRKNNAENDSDEAQAQEKDDEAEKLEVDDDESEEEIDGALEKQVVEEVTLEEESEQRDKESSAEEENGDIDVENQEVELEKTEVTDTKDNEEALAEEDEDAVDEEKQDLENDVGGDEKATAEVNNEKHNEDKEVCEADAENQETEEEIREDSVEKGQETEKNEETQENEAQADEDGGDVDAEDSDETEVQNDNNKEDAYKDEEVEDKDEKEEEQEDKKEENEVTDQAEPGEQAEAYDEGNVASEKDNVVTKECDQQQDEDETQGTEEYNEIEDNPQNENKESQESEEEEAFEKNHKSSEKNENNSAEEEEENADTEGNETSQNKETVVNKSLFNQMTKSSIESQQGSMENSIDKEMVSDNKNKNTASRSSGSSGAKPSQMYPESSSEEEKRESGCNSPEGNQNNAVSASEKEEKTVTSDKSKSTNTEKPKESSIDQDEFDF